MIRLILCFLTASLLLSCGRDERTLDKSAKIDTSAVKDGKAGVPAKALVSELPVQFGGTDILLFAIRHADRKERGGYDEYGSGSYRDSESASGFSSDILSGNFVNLLFQDKNGKETKLTDKSIRINKVTFLREIFNKTKTGYLLYSVFDMDANGDKKLDHWDLEALYLSRVDGSDFRKLTKESHEFHDWRIIKGGKQDLLQNPGRQQQRR